MQRKITRQIHEHSNKMAKTKKAYQCPILARKMGFSHIAHRFFFLENDWQYLLKLNKYLLDGTVIPLPGISQEEWVLKITERESMSVLLVLFGIAGNRK